MLRAIQKNRRYVSSELKIPFGDPFIFGTPDPGSRPYHPSQLSKDFKAFCKMNGFKLTFHDLRHTFATMMIAGGTDVRTVASYLGHSNVAMTLNTYAEVDPDAKRAAVGRISEAFDVDLDGVFAKELVPRALPTPTSFPPNGRWLSLGIVVCRPTEFDEQRPINSKAQRLSLVGCAPIRLLLANGTTSGPP